METDSKTNKECILYVDDEKKSLKYFSLYFSDYFTCHCYENVAEAMNFLQKGGTDVAIIVADQVLPEQSGVDLLEWAHQHRPDSIRILTTAYADIDSSIAAVNRGEIYRYVLKPWDIEGLRLVLHSAARTYRENIRNKELIEERKHAMLMVASQIAHEMRTPLAGIKNTAAGTLRYFPRLVSTYRSFSTASKGEESPIPEMVLDNLSGGLERIDRFVDRANLAIDMMLASAGHLGHQNDWGKYEIRDVIEEAIATYPLSLDQREDIDLVFNAEFDYVGSSILIQHVVYNLLKNSLHACQNRSTRSISIDVSRIDNTGFVRVIDNGTGINKDLKNKIFTPFVTTKDRTIGQGIGLSFCHEVMARHGGDIILEKSDDAGSVFCISLTLNKSSNF